MLVLVAEWLDEADCRQGAVLCGVREIGLVLEVRAIRLARRVAREVGERIVVSLVRLVRAIRIAGCPGAVCARWTRVRVGTTRAGAVRVPAAGRVPGSV